METDLPQETLKLATGFGCGVGLYGDSCGAVMAVRAIHGCEIITAILTPVLISTEDPSIRMF